LALELEDICGAVWDALRDHWGGREAKADQFLEEVGWEGLAHELFHHDDERAFPCGYNLLSLKLYQSLAHNDLVACESVAELVRSYMAIWNEHQRTFITESFVWVTSRFAESTMQPEYAELKWNTAVDS
jgi:hypothetical protein